MNKFIDILYASGILRLSTGKVHKWKERNEVGKLEYALRHGVYNIRESAIEALAFLESSSSIPMLIEALDDDVEGVSFAAMDALEGMGATPEVDKAVENKKAYWSRRRREQQENAERLRNKKKQWPIARWDRPSNKTLENVKQMLRKPMNIGKWL